jgi:hypothetical protein
MSTRTKLFAFAAALAVVFGGAALAGGAVHRIHKASVTVGEMGMKDEPVRGLAVSEGGLTLDLTGFDENSLRFRAGFPTAGSHRLFLQVKVDGRVHTAEFTQEVDR